MCAHAVLIAIIFSVTGEQTAYAQPSSTFDLGAESFVPYNNGPAVLTYNSTGGNPGGYISDLDETWDIWYFRSATGSEWQTDMTPYYGCNLYFEEKASAGVCGPQFPEFEDVALIRTSDGAKICYWTSYNPSSTWTSYTIPLTETGWQWTDNTGAAVTASEFMSFISEVKNVRIRGDYYFCTETIGLDNLMIVCPTLLPVEIADFSGMDMHDGTALLQWETASENNCKGFQVEKSISGDVFDSIGYMPAKGNSTALMYYSFTDEMFSGAAYYRLKQDDNDGISTYSDVITISPDGILSSIPGTSLRLYPNPCTDLLSLESPQTLGNIWIYNSIGQEVYHTISENRTEVINLQKIPAGIYTVHLGSSAGRQVIKFEVVK